MDLLSFLPVSPPTYSDLSSSKLRSNQDFLGGAVVKTLPYNAGVAHLVPGDPGQGTKIPHTSLPKKQKT